MMTWHGLANAKCAASTRALRQGFGVSTPIPNGDLVAPHGRRKVCG